MIKKQLLLLLTIFIVFGLFVYLAKDNLLKNSDISTHVNFSKNKLQAEKITKDRPIQSKFKIPIVGSKRVYPSKNIPNHIITELIEIEKTSELQAIVNKIQTWDDAAPADFSFPNTIQWDISQMPTNNHEYHLFLSEVSSFVLSNLSNAVKKNDLQKVKVAASQQMALRIYSLFDFTSKKDNKGKYILVLSGFEEYSAKMRRKRQDRLPATSSKSSIYNLLSSVDKIHPDLLTRLKNEQTDYYAELPGDIERRKNFIEGDPLNNTYLVIDLIEFIMSKLNENDVNFSSSERFHKKNLKLIQTIVNDARMNPEKYGKKKVNDMTDLDFEIFLKAISKDTAKFWALIGSAFSVAFGEFLTSFFTSVRLSFTLNAFAYVGFEIICTATGLYRGIKQMYVMHRFNSYVRGVKFASEKYNRPFNFHRINQKFSPELVKNSNSFRKLVRDSWLTGVAIGVGLKTLASREAFDAGVLKIIEKSMMSSSFFLRRMGDTMLRLYAAQTVEELIVQLFPRVVKFLTSSKIISYFLKTTATFLGPVLKGISYPILTTIDLSVVYIVTYFGINIRLDPAIKILTKTYASPGTNIQIALANLEKSTSNFKTSTRKIFYPLCAYLASFEQHDVPENGYSKRQEGCKYIIKELEGFESDEEIKSEFPKIYNSLTISQREITDKTRMEEEKVFNTIMNESYSYPPTFKTFWLTGLMSILPRDLITSLYWEIKEAMIYGTGKLSTLAQFSISIFSPDITSPSILMNIERLDYATNLLSTYIYEKENDGQKTPPSNRTYKGFISYTKFHHSIISDIMSNYNEVLNSEEIKNKIDIDIDNESGRTIFEQLGRYVTKTKEAIGNITVETKDYIKEGIRSSAPIDTKNSSTRKIEKEIEDMRNSGTLLY